MCPLNSTNIRNMGNLIDKLSLQNLLRQVFCGLVFFVPLLVVEDCCFALLFGSLVIDEGCEYNVNEWLYIIPLVVLAMIVLIDYHRYQHVRFLVCRDKDASQS